MTKTSDDIYDFVVIGAGFFGLSVTRYLHEKYSDANILVVEKEESILSRASKWNQARVHNGYHYPRSISTAVRSKENYLRFLSEWSDCIETKNISLYCISSQNTKTSDHRYSQFLKNTLLPFKEKTEFYKKEFTPKNIASIYEVEEKVFSSEKIKIFFKKFLNDNAINYQTNTVIDKYVESKDFAILRDTDNNEIKCRNFINCTYAGIYNFNDDVNFANNFKHEVAEIVLIKPPKKFENFNITVMDGPFFSIMSFPDKNLHSLSHVRYTPHFEWTASRKIDPYKLLETKHFKSNYDVMKRDVEKYFPEFCEAEYMESFFEIKTILNKSEVNDSREIVINQKNRAVNILGAKIDQIYDVYKYLDNMVFQ